MKARLLIAATAVLVAGNAPVRAANTDADALRAAENEVAAALVRHDEGAVAAHFAPDWVGQDDAGFHTRADMLGYWLKHVRFTALKLDLKSVRVIGNIGIVVGQDVEKSTFEGKDTSGRYSWIDVFERRGDKWLIIAGQTTRMK